MNIKIQNPEKKVQLSKDKKKNRKSLEGKSSKSWVYPYFTFDIYNNIKIHSPFD